MIKIGNKVQIVVVSAAFMLSCYIVAYVISKFKPTNQLFSFAFPCHIHRSRN